MMLKRFGFAEGEDLASSIIVEFFEDQYEEEFAAAKSLMSALARVGDITFDPNRLPAEAPTSMLICFSGVTDNSQSGTERSVPELELRFGKELKEVTKDHSGRLLLEVLRPTFIQSSSSSAMGTRVRAFLRDNRFLGGSLVVTSMRLHGMLTEWVNGNNCEQQL